MSESNIPESKRFSLVKRAESFAHAGRGIAIFFKSTHNVWIHMFVLVCTILIGVLLHIERTEWMMLVFAGGFVIVSEAFNTAIEIDINLTSPDHHPYARDTKDVAAGAVLISAITAVIIGLFIFIPHIIILG